MQVLETACSVLTVALLSVCVCVCLPTELSAGLGGGGGGGGHLQRDAQESADPTGGQQGSAMAGGEFFLFVFLSGSRAHYDASTALFKAV